MTCWKMYWEIDYMEIIAATRKRDEWKKTTFLFFFRKQLYRDFRYLFCPSRTPKSELVDSTATLCCLAVSPYFFAAAAAAFMQHTHFNETANLFKNRNHSAFLRVVVVIVHILVFAVAPNCCFSVPNICLVPPPSHKLYHHKISHNIRENQFFPSPPLRLTFQCSRGRWWWVSATVHACFYTVHTRGRAMRNW